MRGVEVSEQSLSNLKRRFLVPAIATVAVVGALGMFACSSAATDDAAKSSEPATTGQAVTTEKAATEANLIEKGSEQKGVVTNTIDMSKYEKGKVVRAWLPVPQDGDFQTITDVSFKADTATKAEITTDDLGNKMLYVEWDKDAEPADRIATLTFHADRFEALTPSMVEEGAVPAGMDKYLKGSMMVDVDAPEVQELAKQITEGKTTTLEKTQAIYDWIYENMNRDDSVAGCGDGDVCRLITTSKAGKCTDINSTFVALCRASGIPAREVFGIRINDADITKNQHCWAMFYLPGTGWVPADPADVLKAVLKDNLDKTSDEALAKKDYYWGGWDAKRIELSEGRDLILNPKQDGEALNDFGYPYAEVDGEVIDSFNPTDFAYTYSFEQE